MSDTVVRCPNCSHAFPLSRALAEQLRGEIETSFAARHETERSQLAERIAQAEGRELAAQRLLMELEQGQGAAIERSRLEVEIRLRAEAEAALSKALEEERCRLREDTEIRLRELNLSLQTTRQRLEQSQTAELQLRQQAEALAVREKALDLEVARKLDEKRAEWEVQVRNLAADEQQLKLREKDKTIDDLKRLLDEARRKSEQG